jgi:hypothetical protein
MKLLCILCLVFVTTVAMATDRFVYVNNQNQPNTITAFQVKAQGVLKQLDGLRL